MGINMIYTIIPTNYLYICDAADNKSKKVQHLQDICSRNTYNTKQSLIHNEMSLMVV